MSLQPALKQDLSGNKGDEKEHLKAIGKYDEDLHHRFILWKDQAGHSLKTIATMLSRSTAAVSQYINLKFEGNLAEFEKDVASLLHREENLEFTAAPETFISTNPAVLIWELLQYCDRHQYMGVAVGESGMGKTTTCIEYKKQNRSTLLVTADITTRSVGSILYILNQKIGKAHISTNVKLLHTMIDQLKNSRRLIIIDDAHFLFWEAFEAVRKIHDCGRVGIALVGQERLYEQMKGNTNKAYLYDQVFSRIAAKRDNLRVAKPDMRPITELFCRGLDKECINYLYEQAQRRGHFRKVRMILELATEMHKEFNSPVDINLLRQANEFLMKADKNE